jgi:Na+-driven multidrug efflux pump
MTTTMFLILLSGFSVISSLVTEGIKNVATDKVNLSYNIVALITALIVGGGGTTVYYQLNAVPFTVNNVIYAVLMGLASGLVSMVGFDKVKQSIEQLANKQKG